MAHSWCGGLVVAACCAVSRRASLCRLGLGPRKERKKSPPTRGGEACLLLCTMGNFALGPGLANVLGKDDIISIICRYIDYM